MNEVTIKKFLIVFFLIFAVDMGVNFAVLKVSEVDLSIKECLGKEEVQSCMDKLFSLQNDEGKSKSDTLKYKWLFMIVKDFLVLVAFVVFMGVFYIDKKKRSKLKESEVFTLFGFYFLIACYTSFVGKELVQFFFWDGRYQHFAEASSLINRSVLMMLKDNIVYMFWKDLVLMVLVFAYFFQNFRMIKMIKDIEKTEED